MSEETDSNLCQKAMETDYRQSASTAKKNQLNFQGNLAACFFRFYSYNPSCGNTYSLRQLWTLLLISRKYCHGVLKDEKTDFILYLSRKWFYATFFECSFSLPIDNSLSLPTNLLCLSETPVLRLIAINLGSSRSMLKSYARFCTRIKNANTIKEIRLGIENGLTMEHKILMDLLPDKITQISENLNVMRLMKHRKQVVEMVEFRFECQYDPYVEGEIPIDYKYILESPTRHIKLRSEWFMRNKMYGLAGLHDLYPMKLNPYVEKLDTFAQMITSKFTIDRVNEDYLDMKEDRIWLNGYFEKYKRAFQALYSLNPNLKVYIKDEYSQLQSLITIDKLEEKLRLYFRNTERFCQAAVDAQVNLVELQLRPCVGLPEEGYATTKWKDACIKKIVEIFGFECQHNWNSNCKTAGKMNMCGISVDIQLDVRRGPMYDSFSDPLTGEWSQPEYLSREQLVLENFEECMRNLFEEE